MCTTFLKLRHSNKMLLALLAINTQGAILEEIIFWKVKGLPKRSNKGVQETWAVRCKLKVNRCPSQIKSLKLSLQATAKPIISSSLNKLGKGSQPKTVRWVWCKRFVEKMGKETAETQLTLGLSQSWGRPQGVSHCAIVFWLRQVRGKRTNNAKSNKMR